VSLHLGFADVAATQGWRKRESKHLLAQPNTLIALCVLR
jgi:hypothetical protein